jgi:hypothetical protein
LLLGVKAFEVIEFVVVRHDSLPVARLSQEFV